MDGIQFPALCLSALLVAMIVAPSTAAIETELPDMIEPPAIIESNVAELLLLPQNMGSESHVESPYTCMSTELCSQNFHGVREKLQYWYTESATGETAFYGMHSSSDPDQGAYGVHAWWCTPLPSCELSRYSDMYHTKWWQHQAKNHGDAGRVGFTVSFNDA